MKQPLTLFCAAIIISFSCKAQQESQLMAIDSFFLAEKDSTEYSSKKEASDKEFKRTKNVQKRKDRDFYETKRKMKHGDLDRLRKNHKINRKDSQ